MKINSQIVKIMIFTVGAYILIPRIIISTGMFSTASANSVSPHSPHTSNTLIARKVNSQNLKDIYIPPNYGGPDSQHGSGTR